MLYFSVLVDIIPTEKKYRHFLLLMENPISLRNVWNLMTLMTGFLKKKTVLCIKRFYGKIILKGKRNKLKRDLHPIPTIYPGKKRHLLRLLTTKELGKSIEFANVSVEQGSVLGWIIQRPQKMVLMPPCLTLSIIRYGSRVLVLCDMQLVLSRFELVSPCPFPTTITITPRSPQCNSYWKGSYRITLD